ncbi:MAG: hypothetical protein AUJ74_01075 [Candidatus Omnitrophica bacterium CG1_02_44_16]|nr:MAG: hypothetical protein AUJ74_01075 [Candidatus Omnitrophica bacterium CG1_02_44_16]PIY82426.1 MAG: hypothetical protein COY78_06205 [Candidatus Omnitrophica bacterium CG_4_10_14_0_8_um_filter_44_12]PIZ84685.1 MAG: hypothetical protein COX96_02735 [Candidatus Omnitrophica bacterium CG_4_10_14_0_2_um_filter_44_9]
MDKLWYLKRCDIFNGLSKDDIDKVSAVANDKTIPKKEIIYTPEDEGGVMFILKKGRVKVFKRSADGKMITLAILKDGDIFGAMSEINTGASGAYAETLEDSYICSIRQQDFYKLVQGTPKVAMGIIRKINQKLQDAEDRIADLVFRDVPGRIASVLLKLAERFGKDSPSGTQISFKITHQELADMVGTTRETATVILNELKEDEVLLIEDKHITVIDEKALKDWAGME